MTARVLTGVTRTLCESRDVTMWHSPDTGDALTAKFADGRPDRRLQWEVALDPRNFGAKGDGVTDDTQAFVDMIAAKDRLQHGAAFVLPSLKFKLAGPISIGSKSALWRGSGWRRPSGDYFGTSFSDLTGTILYTADATHDLLVDPSGASVFQGAQFEDIAFLGPGSGTTTGLRFMNDAEGVSVRTKNLFFCNWNVGFDPGALEESRFEHTHAIGCNTGVRIGLTPGGSSATSLVFDHVLAQLCGTGIDVQTCLTSKFIGTFMQGNVTYGMRIRNVAHLDVDVSHCENNGSAGVRFDQSVGGETAQHVDLHGLRASTATDGLSFTGAGAVAYCNFHHIDYRNIAGDMTFPSNVSNCSVYDVQTATGGIVFNGAGNWARTLGKMYISSASATGSAQVLAGAGSPAGAVAAPVGSVFLRVDGGASTVLYVKESGGSTSAGWVAK